MTKPLLIALIVVAALAAAVLIAGLLLPATRSATVVATLPAPPERVWALITDVRGQTAWRRGVRAVAGDAAAWTETTDHGQIAFTTTAQEPPTRWALAFTGPTFSGTWEGRLEPDGTGTRITVTESVTTPGRIGRVVARLLVSPAALARTWCDEVAAALARP
jgi:uncharacterized protein YndB with AHSA1/START domain